jgi:hypothetical protein
VTSRFDKLLEPGTIGPVRTRNSIMEEDQTVGPRTIAYCERLCGRQLPGAGADGRGGP